MDELLASLLAAAIHFSGLPPIDAGPPVQAMPYDAMLAEICADMRGDHASLLTQYRQCAASHQLMLGACEELKTKTGRYDQCVHQQGLAAAFIIAQHRIVYRDDLNLDDDTDNSFLVHEYVHALQSHHLGDQVFASCAGVMAAEKQAYAAQQQYLRSRGQLLAVGDRLRLVTCSDIS
jgi:hypothetical protein